MCLIFCYCEMYKKYLKKKKRITEHLNFWLVPSFMYNEFRHFFFSKSQPSQLLS